MTAQHSIEGITLGDQARDTVTGFQGAVMGITHYLTGCDQLLLVPTALSKDGDLREGHWFDLERVEAVKLADRVVLPKRNRPASGGPRGNAGRRTH